MLLRREDSNFLRRGFTFLDKLVHVYENNIIFILFFEKDVHFYEKH